MSPKRVKTTYDYEIAIIRKALKSLAPTLSVRKGRGTAYGWIEIWGSGRFREFTEKEKRALEKFGLPYGANNAVISPESRRYWVEKAALLLDIELPEPLKRAYEEEDREKEEARRRRLELKRKQETCDHEWVVMPYSVIFPPDPDAEVWRCKKCGLEKIVTKKHTS